MMNQDRFRPFRRLPGPGWLGGVCAGIAYSLAAPTWLVRLLWVLFSVGGFGFCVLLYFLLWIFVPADAFTPPDYGQRTGDVARV